MGNPSSKDWFKGCGSPPKMHSYCGHYLAWHDQVLPKDHNDPPRANKTFTPPPVFVFQRRGKSYRWQAINSSAVVSPPFGRRWCRCEVLLPILLRRNVSIYGPSTANASLKPVRCGPGFPEEEGGRIPICTFCSSSKLFRECRISNVFLPSSQLIPSDFTPPGGIGYFSNHSFTNFGARALCISAKWAAPKHSLLFGVDRFLTSMEREKAHPVIE